MEANSTSTNDGTDTEVTDLRELMRRIHESKVRLGYWDFVDPKYPEKGPMVAPMMVDNQKKILTEVYNLLVLAMWPEPERCTSDVVDIIYALLDFCQAHGCDVVKQLNKPFYENQA